LVISIIARNQPTQILENFHPFQRLLVACKHLLKSLLGTHGGRMLTLPLPPPLTQLCAVMTSIEILHRRLQTTTIASGKREGPFDRDANEILGMAHEKMSA